MPAREREPAADDLWKAFRILPCHVRDWGHSPWTVLTSNGTLTSPRRRQALIGSRTPSIGFHLFPQVVQRNRSHTALRWGISFPLRSFPNGQYASSLLQSWLKKLRGVARNGEGREDEGRISNGLIESSRQAVQDPAACSPSCSSPLCPPILSPTAPARHGTRA